MWRLTQNKVVNRREMPNLAAYTVQNIKFSFKDFFCKGDQIHSFMGIWSNLLKKFLIENCIFCALIKISFRVYYDHPNLLWPQK